MLTRIKQSSTRVYTRGKKTLSDGESGRGETLIKQNRFLIHEAKEQEDRRRFCRIKFLPGLCLQCACQGSAVGHPGFTLGPPGQEVPGGTQKVQVRVILFITGGLQASLSGSLDVYSSYCLAGQPRDIRGALFFQTRNVVLEHLFRENVRLRDHFLSFRSFFHSSLFSLLRFLSFFFFFLSA